MLVENSKKYMKKEGGSVKEQGIRIKNSILGIYLIL